MSTYSEKLQQELLTKKYGGIETPEYLDDVARLKNGEPLEYVIGFTDFLGCRIDLSLKPMIPRPETAFWVERAIGELKERKGTLRLADIFSGSGNVGVALLAHLPHAKVVFSEVDPKLREQIKINCKRNNISRFRYSIVTANVLDGLRGTYDAMFAVPPYVAHEALPDLDPEMRDHEPHLAFFAEEDGNYYHRILIENAWEYLRDGGSLYMEADMGQEKRIAKYMNGTNWSGVEFWPDPYGATPNVVLRK